MPFITLSNMLSQWDILGSITRLFRVVSMGNAASLGFSLLAIVLIVGTSRKVRVGFLRLGIRLRVVLLATDK